MALYEFTIILRPDLNGAEVEKAGQEIASIAKDAGASVVKQENWGLRRLAYPINKNSKGHYLFYGLDAPAGALQEMERRLRIDESVMRQLTVRVDEIEKDPSAPIRQDDERDAA